MTLATSGRGPLAALSAFASQVHPVFMLPPLSSSLFGGLLAASLGTATFVPRVAAVHLVAAFFALYTAHVKDGYVDFYARGEDDDHPLTARGCRVALAGASVAFFACVGLVWYLVGPVAALITLPGWLIGFNHAPRLDMHPVSATAGYPTGIAFALLGGYYVQATTLSPTVLALAVVFLLVLSGIKVIDDSKDYDYDQSIGKRTAAVAIGPEAAYRAAYALMATGQRRRRAGRLRARRRGRPPGRPGTRDETAHSRLVSVPRRPRRRGVVPAARVSTCPTARLNEPVSRAERQHPPVEITRRLPRREWRTRPTGGPPGGRRASTRARRRSTPRG
jgi:4-hydroxybenzoate polyprenyltransferase